MIQFSPKVFVYVFVCRDDSPDAFTNEGMCPTNNILQEFRWMRVARCHVNPVKK